MSNNFKVIADTCVSKYVFIYDIDKKKRYPIKRVATPSSRYSTARWFLSKSPIINKAFNPIIRIAKGVSGQVIYNVWEDVIEVPEHTDYCSTI